MNVLPLLVLVSKTNNKRILGVLIHGSIDTGAQPLVSDDDNLILCVNGEIYNHKQLRANLKNKYEFKTHSDCEVIMHMVRFDDDDVKLHS